MRIPVEQSNPGRIDYFLKQNLDYEEGQFDGVLVWDALEYLAPPLLAAVIERLRKIVRPKSYMLAFFHVDESWMRCPFYTFRIQDLNSLQVAQHGMRTPAQLFNNRSLEKLFGKFESVKFFLTRERLREVIVKVVTQCLAILALDSVPAHLQRIQKPLHPQTSRAAPSCLPRCSSAPALPALGSPAACAMNSTSTSKPKPSSCWRREDLARGAPLEQLEAALRVAERQAGDHAHHAG